VYSLSIIAGTQVLINYTRRLTAHYPTIGIVFTRNGKFTFLS